MKPAIRRIALHVPLLIAGLITVVASMDIEVFHPLKTESSFGYWVVVLVPFAVLLLLAQIWIWIVLLVRRLKRRS